MLMCWLSHKDNISMRLQFLRNLNLWHILLKFYSIVLPYAYYSVLLYHVSVIVPRY